MILWRISIFDDLSGLGGEVATGRWHTPATGKRIVYLAEHPALSLVESIVNLRGREDTLPDGFRLLRIDAHPEVSVAAIPENSLAGDWRQNKTITQEMGNQWLAQNETALLAVPSAPSPESTNYLLNPRHPDASQVVVAWSRWLRYDRRLFRLSE